MQLTAIQHALIKKRQRSPLSSYLDSKMQAPTVEKFTSHAIIWRSCTSYTNTQIFLNPKVILFYFNTAVILGKDGSTHGSIYKLNSQNLVFSLDTLAIVLMHASIDMQPWAKHFSASLFITIVTLVNLVGKQCVFVVMHILCCSGIWNVSITTVTIATWTWSAHTHK